jgi:hypothetical protein
VTAGEAAGATLEVAESEGGCAGVKSGWRAERTDTAGKAAAGVFDKYVRGGVRGTKREENFPDDDFEEGNRVSRVRRKLE